VLSAGAAATRAAADRVAKAESFIFSENVRLEKECRGRKRNEPRSLDAGRELLFIFLPALGVYHIFDASACRHGHAGVSSLSYWYPRKWAVAA
jgi:hypothetical protein